MEGNEPVSGAAEEEIIPQSGEEEVTPEEKTAEAPEDLKEDEIVEDPGQFEGMADEKENYSKRVTERIDKLTKSWRETERERDENKTKYEEEIRVLKEKVELSKIEPAERPLPQQVAPVEQPAQPPDFGNELTKLKSEMKQAMIDLDGEKQAELYDKIEDVKDKISNEKYATSSKKITRELQQKEIDEGVSYFVSKNDWFAEKNANGSDNPNYNYAKAGAAITLEKKLAPQYASRPYRELLDAVHKKIDEDFNHKMPSKPKLSAVGAVTKVKPTTNHNVIALTYEQKKAANGIFPESKNPEQEYINLIKSQKGA